jgi:hypothetical protein
MIIKERDSRENEIRELKKLLELPITPKQRFLIERELRALKKGVSGEDDSAYYINFYYGSSKNWAVIHDLRIEYEGQVAQIDHVMIGRMLDIFVLESKNYSYGIRINDKGEFELLYDNKYHGIASPIEQNRRHIYVLEKFLTANNILPKRLGLTLKPKFRSLVLISPKAIIKRPPQKKFDTSMVIKADALDTTVQGCFENITASELLTITKFISSDTLRETAEKLASYHKPSSVDYRAKFNIEFSKNDSVSDNQSKKTTGYFCAKCKKPILDKVAKFCWNNKKRFGGRAYCFDCQKLF